MAGKFTPVLRCVLVRVSISLHCCLMIKLTCLTLETFPAGGAVTGVWSQTLAAIFTLLQTDSCSENRERSVNTVYSRICHSASVTRTQYQRCKQQQQQVTVYKSKT